MTSGIVGALFTSARDRKLLLAFLGAEGYEAWCPSSIEEFESDLSAQLERLSIVIVEQGVARKLGQYLLAARDSREVPLPVVVALKQGSPVTPWLRAGFDDYLTLPMETHQLRARLALTLQTRARAVKRLEVRNRELEVRNDLLSQARAEAESASLAKSEFIANISHELRTPLHGILGSVEILKMQPGDPEQVELIEINGRSLLGLVSELLSYASLESGQTKIASRPVDLRRHLRAILDPIRRSAEESGLEFEEDIDSALPPFIHTDPQRFSQIVGNLLSNAVKFTSSGVVRFSLRYSQSRLDMVFEDTGIGIPQEQIAEVFNPFHQVDTTTTRSFEGAGLGLAIVKRLVTALGGEIDLQSQLGKGTRLRVTLPAPPGGPPETAGEAPSPSSRSLSVLVVEDNVINSKVMHTLLRLWKHQPTAANSGEEALELQKHHRFDVVLMDVQMPGLSGLETTRRWRQREQETSSPPIPVIALTARASERDREICLECGMNEFLEKPPDHRRLRSLLESAAAEF